MGKANSSDALSRDGAARSSDEAAVMVAKRRGCVIFGRVARQPRKWEERVT